MINEYKIQETVRISKEAFYENEARRALNGFEFLLVQGRYIRKSVWIMQAVLLALVFAAIGGDMIDRWAFRMMGAAAPLFVILLIPELWKNRISDAMEIESSTVYSLHQIYGARMLLCAGVDLVMVTVFIGVLSARFSLWLLTVHFLLPLTVACCLCFWVLYSFRFGSETLAVMLCILWSGVWCYMVLNEAVYFAISDTVWLAAILGAVICLVLSVYYGQRRWNKIWEIKPIWN